MSRFADLVAKSCPDGVQYLPLSDVAEYSKTRVPSAQLSNGQYVGVENLLQDCRGRVESEISQKISANVTAFVESDVLIGNIRPYLKKIWLADSSGGASGDVLVIRRKTSFMGSMSPEFLYYVLSDQKFFDHSNQFARGAGMPRGDKQAIMNYLLPIPPMEVQLEIVRILDAMTSLQAELQAELAARQKQYEYYRDTLLTFDKPGTPPREVDDLG